MYETGTLKDLSTYPSIYAKIGENPDKEITPYKLPSTNDGCYASYQALVIPDGVSGGSKEIKVVVDDIIYTLSSVATYNPRYRYTYNITVQEEGLEVSVAQSTTWTDGNDGSGSVALP